MLFAGNVPEDLNPVYTLLPSLNPLAKAPDFAYGVLTFLKYDMWSMLTSSHIWGLALLTNVQPRGSAGIGWWVKRIFGLAVTGAVMGPAASVMFLVWERDEKVLGTEEDAIEKKLL
jgi:hypothetical protein